MPAKAAAARASYPASFFICEIGPSPVDYIAPQPHHLKGSKMKNLLSRIAVAVLLGAVLVALSPVSAVDVAPPPKNVAEVLQPYVDNHTLAGAVGLVANKDKVLDVEAVGYADVSGSRPMLIDAIFWIASMSKPITAAALMMLVDEGKLKLDDPVEKYLPEFKNLQVKGKQSKELITANHPITIREILSHTSGLIFLSPQEKPTIDVLPLKDAVASYPKIPLLFQPGTSYQYSN